MTKEEESASDFTRRPNPKGWTLPKAPYNPYDPADVRPAQGYPSEYNLPGQQPKGFSSIPRQPTQYQKVNETMERLNYTARPRSDLYPGQYKVLRRVDTNRNLNIGSRWFGTFLGGSIVIYFVFFYRWNEGRENVFTGFYRSQLWLKEKLFGLTKEQYDDLHFPHQSHTMVKGVKDALYIPEDMRKTQEGQFALNRPSERHILEAERIQQEREEELLSKS
ncbi:hypothetical protein KGF56_004226 [Candida oxycetoniae]|uniref:Uncharacterized protein n=1 Tax=Candida oxycetoniae TaxID=497107 RepID=A0AAI9SUB9_9ASCO|nr:uncharacterized protein KGF56_004226 [Candida oxycetoniae]KAI3402973.1 hypothetical protein KGF56_004226 [Candida oxycetoniae]